MNHTKSTTFLFYMYFLMVAQVTTAAASTIEKVNIQDKQILLVIAKLNDRFLQQTIEAYKDNETYIVAIEPLFDALNLKYQLYPDKLIVWKGEEPFTFNFKSADAEDFYKANNTPLYWASDEGYIFLDINTLSRFFDSSFELNEYQLIVQITTLKDTFPIEIITQQNNERLRSAVLTSAKMQEEGIKPHQAITIADKYQLFTVPHGRINASLALSDQNQNNTIAVQTTSDLLYHSASFTLGKVKGDDFASNLRFTRYKTTPNDYILGAFDQYSFGDISGYGDSLISQVNSGVGLILNRGSENFRRNNSSITIKESAPPGWEAELYHNNRFIKLTTVPDNGQLIFDDVDTEYGSNLYQIKLYGPYGEEDIIEKYVALNANALTKGDMNYSLYTLDKNHSLFNDNNTASRGITDFGGVINYGISDRWQLGFNYANLKDDNNNTKQFLNVKNALSFPGFLLENDFAINQNGGYAQLTSITGNGFGNQNYSVSYQSAKDYTSSRISAENTQVHLLNASYAGSLLGWGYGFSGEYSIQDNLKIINLSNRLSTSYKQLYFTHSLNYSKYSNEILSSTTDDIINTFSDSSLTGSMNISGPISTNVRISGSINYDPEKSNPILNNSSLNLQTKIQTFGVTNYITASYLPLIDSNNKWQLTHNVAWETPEFQYVFSSSYNADERWSFNAGIRFFLGYDYHNNRLLFRNRTSSSTATLDVHTYLDRQANGVPDVLDYDLSDVSFLGSSEWQGITSGIDGKTILHGVPALGVFGFGAQWQDGTKTVNNDYVIYTHPGAYVEVNMPFTLNNEFFGFVLKEGNQEPIRNVNVELIGTNSRYDTKTDADGYYGFTGVTPDQYIIKISDEFLQNRGYTGNITGYQLTTPYHGGFVELDSFLLQRKQDETSVLKEKIIPFTLTINNSETIVTGTEQTLKNAFTLPTKGPTQIVHSLGQGAVEQPNVTVNTLPRVSTTDSIALSKAVVRTTLSSSNINSNTEIDLADYYEVEDRLSPSNDSKNILFYTIQLGVYKLESSAQIVINNVANLNQKSRLLVENESDEKIFKVVLGEFSSHQEADFYAKNKLPAGQAYFVRLLNPLPAQAVTSADERINEAGWVIQILAQKTPITTNDIDLKYRNLEGLYLAKKENVSSGEVFFCLISKVFTNKTLAKVEQEKSGIAGWITQSNNFMNLTKLDN